MSHHIPDTGKMAMTCCPFCGAELRQNWSFECGSGPAWNILRSNRCLQSEAARLTRERDDWKRVAEGMNAFMERARAKTTNTREGLECLREFDALKAKEAQP